MTGDFALFPVDAAAAGLLERRARRLAAARATAGTPDGIAVLCFRIAAESYAVPLTDLAEVLALPGWTPVPGMPAELLGVTNVQGAIRPVLNLHAMLGLPDPPEDSRAWGVFLKAEGERGVGLRVDALEDIRHVDPATLAPPPAESALIAGITPQTLILLDSGRILAAGVLRPRQPMKEPSA